MRFTVNVVGIDGRQTSRRPVLKGCVRMDHGEHFRLLFENDWDSAGVVRYVYNGTVMALDEPIEHNDFVASPQIFTWERTALGAGRLVEVSFERAGCATPDIRTIMLINNDYRADGSVVNYGDKDTGDRVEGRAQRPEDDPDRHMRANDV